MKKFLIVSLTIVCVFAFSEIANAQNAKRITFAKGATSTVVAGTLAGFDDVKTFVIRVRKGQKLDTVQQGTNNITISITDPNGQDASDADASCNNRKTVTPTIAGDYTLRVVQCQKADEWNGKFSFRITVR